MPVYEYYCPKCTSKYELLRPMSRSDEPGTCPKGHGGGTRTLSIFAAAARNADGSGRSVAGGGCACGNGACGCGH